MNSYEFLLNENSDNTKLCVKELLKNVENIVIKGMS